MQENMEEPMDTDVDYGFHINEINTILSNERNIPENLNSQYSSCFVPVVTNNWSSIATSTTTGVGLVCNQFQYRLALMPPSEQQETLNYWPEPLGDHENMVKFVKGLLMNYFGRPRTPVYINFSPSSVCLEHNGNTHFMYSSRSNFSCLEVAFLIHSDETLIKFCDEILSSYSLQQYMVEAIESLQDKYDGFVVPIGITFHLTNCVTRIYGLSKLDIGLSGKQCCDSGRKLQQSNDCVWQALSSFQKNGQFIKTKGEKHRCLPNKRVAKKLKIQFLRWYKRKNYEYYGDPISKSGFDERFFFLLEEFTKRNIMVYSDKIVRGKIMCNKGLVNDKSRVRILKVEYRGQLKYDHTLSFLSDGSYHIRAIVCPTAFSSKMICEKCNMGFKELSLLRAHDCSKRTYRPDSLYIWKRSFQQLLSCVDITDKFHIDQNYGHLLINGLEFGKISMNLVMYLEENCPLSIEETFDSVEQIVQYLMIFLPKAVSKVLAIRLKNNLVYLNCLEKRLNELAEKTKDMKFSRDGMNLEYEQFMQVKSQVIDHLSKYAIVIQCGIASGHNLSNILMFELLRALICEDGNKLETRFAGGKMVFLSNKGFPIRFMSLNDLHSAFIMDKVADSEVNSFKKLVLTFKKQFNVNLLMYHSIGSLGNGMLADVISEKNRLSFFSPTLEMYNHLAKCVKYGLFGSKKMIIHPEACYKSAISVDFEKFYARLLLSDRHNEIWNLGRPLKYQLMDQKFVCVKSRQRKTFANLILILIEFCCKAGSEVISSLCGREQRWRAPIDGVLIERSSLNHDVKVKKTLISVDGCFIHSDLDVICHQPDHVINSIDKDHQKHCKICGNVKKTVSNMDLRLKPALFKFLPNETKTSYHRLRKKLTYEQVYHETKRMRQEIAESCDFDHVIIKECEVLKYYFSPLWEFFENIGLEMKPELKMVSFYEMFTNLAYKNFPLLKYGPNLSQQKVIEAIKLGHMRGFVLASTKAGTKTQKLLDIAHPFFFREHEGSMPQSSFEFEKKLVSTHLLKELLNTEKLDDFYVSEIFSIFEYRKYDGKSPFHCFKDKYLLGLKNNCDNKLFTQILKGAINNAIGLMGFVCQKYNRTTVLKNSDVGSMLQMRHFSHGIGINDDYSMMHFRNKSSIFNLSHLHMSLIEMGKVVMIRFILQLKEYFSEDEICVSRLNTDGCLICGKTEQSLENLSLKKLTSVVLDNYLKRPLSSNMAKNYFAFKETYFKELGTCKKHVHDYVRSLTGLSKFVMNKCCEDYENCFAYLPLNLELVADRGIILSTNKLCIVNTNSNVCQTKCSGHADLRLVEIEKCSLKDLNAIIDKS